MLDVVVAEFEEPEAAVQCARRARELGYVRIEAFSPFPVPELDEAIGLRRPRVPIAALVAGVTGCVFALLVQWWTNAFNYAIDVGGRPMASWPTYIVIMFETTVLFTACIAFVAVLFGSRLPRLHDDDFDMPGFERTTVDRFWVAVGDPDRRVDSVAREEMDMLRTAMQQCGALAIHDFRSRP